MNYKRSPRGHSHKQRRTRPITLSWLCGHQTKSWEKDPNSRRDLKARAKREPCEACQREAAWTGRRDIGIEEDDEDIAWLDALFAKAPMTAAEAQQILAGDTGEEVRRAA